MLDELEVRRREQSLGRKLTYNEKLPPELQAKKFWYVQMHRGKPVDFLATRYERPELDHANNKTKDEDSGWFSVFKWDYWKLKIRYLFGI